MQKLAKACLYMNGMLADILFYVTIVEFVEINYSTQAVVLLSH